MVACLKSIQGREIRGPGVTGDISVAGGICGDGISPFVIIGGIIFAPPQIGRIDQLPLGIDLGHEAVVAAV
jgi:hypothetical protein